MSNQLAIRTEVAQRNKLHLLGDAVGPLPSGVERYEAALTASGVKVLSFREFGSYQGDWWAKVQFPNREQYFVTGSYGSCSACDAFEGQFGYQSDRRLDYLHRLQAFGRDYLENCFTLEQAIREASKHISWDGEASRMVSWIKSEGEGMNPTKYTTDYLLEIAASAKLPKLENCLLIENGDLVYDNRTHEAKDGWKVVIFWDGGEYDYVDHLIAPDGSVISPWDWGTPSYNSNDSDMDKMRSYRGEPLDQFLDRWAKAWA